MESVPRVVRFNTKLNHDVNQNTANEDDVEIFEVIEFSNSSNETAAVPPVYVSDSDEIEILEVSQASSKSTHDVITISEEEDLDHPRKKLRSSMTLSASSAAAASEGVKSNEIPPQQELSNSKKRKAPAKRRTCTPRRNTKRKTPNQIPRLAENVNLINLNLVHLNGYWKMTRSSQLKKKKYECNRCLLSFGTIEELNQHIDESFAPENFFVCMVCQERKPTKEDLNHHIGYHHVPKLLRCMLCKKLTEYCIAKHQDYIYSIKDKNYDCVVCSKEFCTLRGFKRHLGN